MVVAVPDLLRDAREPEQPIHLVEQPLRPWPSGGLTVDVDELLARRHARRVGGLHTEGLHPLVVAGLDPVGQRRPEVHERVADRGQFPVEHRLDVGQVVRVQHHVVEAPVVVDDARGHVSRLLGIQPRHDAFAVGHIRCPGLPVPRGPTLHLPPHVTVSLVEGGQVTCRRVHRVQVDERADEGLRHRLHRRTLGQVATQDRAADELADEQWPLKGRLITGNREHLGNLVVRRTQGRQQLGLPLHVVGAARLASGG